LAKSALGRGRLQVRSGRLNEAFTDFDRAVTLGADGELSPPEAAIVRFERGNIPGALEALFQKPKTSLNSSNSAPALNAKSR
jgi:hypothetical protein